MHFLLDSVAMVQKGERLERDCQTIVNLVQVDDLLEQFFPTHAVFAFLLQALQDESLDLGRHGDAGVEKQGVLLDGGDQIGDRAGPEGALSLYHFVQNYSQRPNVSVGRVTLPFEYFWCHVERRAQHSFGHLVVSELLAKAEVCKFEDALTNQQIFRFQVAVYDVMFSENSESVYDLTKNLQSSFLFQFTFFLEEVVQSAPFAVLVDKIAIVFCLQKFEKSDDMRRGLQNVVH